MTNDQQARQTQFERDLTQFDKTAFMTYNSFEEADQADRDYWRSRTPQERLIALEHIRALNYGYADDAQPRPEFQRLYRSHELRAG